MRYALLLSFDEDASVGAEAATLAAFDAFFEKAGERVVGTVRLRHTATATCVRLRADDLVIVDGPFAETKEQIGGFILVDCADLDEAIELAAEVPVAQIGTVEVRPVWEL